MDLVDADLARKVVGGFLVVARQEYGAHIHSVQALDHRLRLGTQRIGEGERTDAPLLFRREHERLAFGAQTL